MTVAARLIAAEPDSSAICARIAQLNLASGGYLSAALYAENGAAVCPQGAPSLNPEQLSAQSGIRSEQQTRTLLQKLDSSNHTLKVSKNQKTPHNIVFCNLLMLIPLIIIILIVLFWLQRKALSSGRVSIQALLKQLEKTSPEQPDFGIDTSAIDDPELQQLTVAYQRIIDDLSLKLLKAHQFTANVTHELRTPLTILHGETELALRSTRDNEKGRRTFESNLEEIKRMSHLIDDLLLLSKSDLGEIPLRPELMFLPELIVELQHQARILAQDKNIKVELNCPTDSNIYLSADNLRLRQVFLNLLTNAIRYTPEGGTIFIEVAEHQDTVDISIRDTGVGMGQEHLERIFDRFYRIDKTKNRNDGGSGLGLSIVQWIVEAHEGKITVTSEIGKGSCFTRDPAAGKRLSPSGLCGRTLNMIF